jgi:uracil-DNA glycosylase
MDSIQQKPYFLLLETLTEAAYQNQSIYPKKEDRFAAFALTPLEKVRVVILGQDPYHQPHQAHGLAFSVPSGIALPPSLRNIYREIENDLSVTMNHQSGDLSHWASQGVLLLNTSLTVEEGKPLSHRDWPYPLLMNDIFNALNQQNRPMIFLLWGKHAQSYEKKIAPHHTIFKANHPSPLSANRGGWFGCKHFSKTNQWLIENGEIPIQWQNAILL